MWEKVIKLAATLAGAAVGIFGEWNMLLTVLAVVMSLDYISGVIVAAAGRSLKTEGGGLDSKTGFIGLAKKGFIVIIVLLATMLDRALGTDAMVFQMATTCYYIANEGISILENAGLMGLPVPAAVHRALEQMREKHDSDSE
ncbi:phage holin family protein [Eubacteriales bacterium OttesenSCG-928-N13]|nr:phage holin family protein [Eubacteriales bacterium OttesenSCG-928-N13]